jgi:hypothetical protein
MGEFSALKELSEKQRNAITPLLEILSGTQPSSIVENIANCWSENLPIMVDFSTGDSDFEPDSDEKSPPDRNICDCFSIASERSLCLIPVTGINMPDLPTLTRIHSENKCGVCLRLRSFNFEDGSVTERVVGLIKKLGLQQADIDLLVDLGAINHEQSAIYIMAITGMLSMLNQIKARRFILASSAFPESLSGLARDSIVRVPRADWMLWNAVVERIKGDSLAPSYSDYGIAHPELPNIDPKMMNPSAGIRYTVDEDWLVVKGRGLKSEAGFAQLHDLSRRLVEHPEFGGLEYCWGDSFIRACAEGGKTGNLTTWRKVGTNRHLCKVIDQLASRP